MRKILKYFIGITASLVLPLLLWAASPASDSLKKVGEGSGGGGAPWQSLAEGTNDLATIVGIVIKAFLSLLGVLFLVYTLYAGYNWMIARGDEEKVSKAKETIQRAIIGLIITIAAYAISYWVFGSLLQGTNVLTP